MIRRLSLPLVAALAFSLASTGCHTQVAAKSEYQMGEKAVAGPLTYTVVEKLWRSQLGEGFQIRMPENRFLLVSLAVTNGSGNDVSVPLLELEGTNGKTYRESDNGEGVDNWFGLMRNLTPQQTMQGRLLFDVPEGSYRLKLSDGNSTSEKYTYVQIPLSIDEDTTPPAPVPSK